MIQTISYVPYKTNKVYVRGEAYDNTLISKINYIYPNSL